MTMYFLYYGHLFWLLELVAIAVTGNASTIPQRDEELDARVSRAPAIMYISSHEAGSEDEETLRFLQEMCTG